MVNDIIHAVPSVREGRFDCRLGAEAAYLEPASRQHTRALRCAFTLRYAGRSGQEFNLSFDRGDRPDVLANRRRLLKAMGMGQATLCSVRQVHGNTVCVVDDHALARGLAGVSADALVTALPNVPLGVLVADCLPVILYSSHPRALAVVHAGRMGTYHQIVLETLAVMRQRYAVAPHQVQAIIGPRYRRMLLPLGSSRHRSVSRPVPGLGDILFAAGTRHVDDGFGPRESRPVSRGRGAGDANSECGYVYRLPPRACVFTPRRRGCRRTRYGSRGAVAGMIKYLILLFSSIFKRGKFTERHLNRLACIT